MQRPLLARDMMKTNLVTLSPEMNVFDAIDVLLKRHISGAPVVEGDQKFLGMFSEKSCLEFILAASYDGMPGAELMNFVNREHPTINEETDMLTIAQTFLDSSCRRLPILRNGRLLGQISRRDLIAAVQESLRWKVQPPIKGLYLSAVQTEE